MDGNTGQVDPKKYTREGCSFVLAKYIGAPVVEYLGGRLLSETLFEQLGPNTGVVFSSILLGFAGLLIINRSQAKTFAGNIAPFIAGILGPEKTNETVFGIQAFCYCVGFSIGGLTNLLSRHKKDSNK